MLEDIKHISVVDRIAQNILDSIAEPHYLEGHKIFTTLSIGITIYPIDEKDVLHDLVAKVIDIKFKLKPASKALDQAVDVKQIVAVVNLGRHSHLESSAR